MLVQDEKIFVAKRVKVEYRQQEMNGHAHENVHDGHVHDGRGYGHEYGYRGYGYDDRGWYDLTICCYGNVVVAANCESDRVSHYYDHGYENEEEDIAQMNSWYHWELLAFVN